MNKEQVEVAIHGTVREEGANQVVIDIDNGSVVCLFQNGGLFRVEYTPSGTAGDYDAIVGVLTERHGSGSRWSGTSSVGFLETSVTWNDAEMSIEAHNLQIPRYMGRFPRVGVYYQKTAVAEAIQAEALHLEQQRFADQERARRQQAGNNL